jgi:hypothetical protein
MTSNPESNAPGMGAFAEVEAAILREVTSGLRFIEEELKKRKLPAIKINNNSWLDDYNGVTRYITVHGFLLNKNKYAQLYSTVSALLRLAEIEVERLGLYATVEDGITVHIEKDVSNEYGRELGTDHRNLPIEFLIEEAKEKAQQYNIDKLKEALHRLLESLEEVTENEEESD